MLQGTNSPDGRKQLQHDEKKSLEVFWSPQIYIDPVSKIAHNSILAVWVYHGDTLDLDSQDKKM